MGRRDWRYLSVDEFINMFLGAFHSRRGRVLLASVFGAAVLVTVLVAPGAFGEKPKNPAAAAAPTTAADVTVSVPGITTPDLILPRVDVHLGSDEIPAIPSTTVATTTSAPTTTTPATFPPATFPPAVFPPATTPHTAPKTPPTPDTGVVVPYGPTTTVHH
jgi:hypothetical protein